MRRFFSAYTPDFPWYLLAVFLAGIGDGLWLHLQPLYIESLGARPEQVGAVLGLAGVAVIFVYLPSGWLVDRGRRKLVLQASWAVTILGLSVAAVAPDWRWAVPGLALYLLASFARPALSGQVAAMADARHIGRAFAISSTAWLLGSLISPAAGGWIGQAVSLRAVYGVSAVIYVFSFLCLGRLRAAPAAGQARLFRVRHLLTRRAFAQQLLVITLITFALNLGLALAPNYLRAAKGLAVQSVGELGTVAALGSMTLTLLVGQLAAGRRLALLVPQAAVLAALGLLLAAPPAPGAIHPLLFAAYFLRGGEDALWAPIAGRVTASLPPEARGLGFGLRDTFMRVALVAAPFTAGQLFQRGPEWPLYASAGALGLTMVLTLTLPRRPAPVVVEPWTDPAAK
ncbi:MAG: MFS transporter [Anaerolineales bacterium]|nr:MFS transporter [Anaerolineales bacterium]